MHGSKNSFPNVMIFHDMESARFKKMQKLCFVAIFFIVEVLSAALDGEIIPGNGQTAAMSWEDLVKQ